MSNSTITVQQVVNYAQQHNELMPLTGVGGVANEPALSIANDTLTMLLSESFPWKFNRGFMPVFVTCPNKQDYKFAGSCAFTTTGGGVGIDLKSNNAITQAGSTVTVRLLESCTNVFNVGDTVYITNTDVTGINAIYTAGQGNGGNSSGWSNGFTIATIATDGLSFTFTYAPAITTTGAPGLTDVNWLEYATMIQTSSTATVPYVWMVQSVRTLEPSSFVGIPNRISVIQDYGTGVIQLRLRPLPGSMPFTVSVVYQKKATLFTSLSSTWAPFPDTLAHCIRQMFTAMCYRFAQSPRADVEFQKAMALVMQTSGADDREDSEEYITPDESITSGYGWGGWFW